MRIIDFHIHAFPDDVAEAALAALRDAGELMEARTDGTVSGTLAAMDAAGVGIGVIQPVATKASQVRSINDWAAGIRSDRIVAFGAMFPDFPDPAAEIARMAGLGLPGFKMHPEHQEFEPHERRLDPIYEAAREHGLTIFCHAGHDEIHSTSRGTPESFAEVLDRWPGLSLALAHLGGYRTWEGVEELLVGRDVWFDTAYTLGHLPDDDFLRMVRAHGADRVLFGSDAPWTDTARELDLLREVALTPDELDAILGGNAARLLGA